MAVLHRLKWVKILLVVSFICFVLQLTLVQMNMFSNSSAVRTQETDHQKAGERFEQRYILLHEACHFLSQREKYDSLCGHVLENGWLGLSWCYVPKAGCTFWKKVFYFLQKRAMGDNSSTISQIGFRQVHSASIQNLCRIPHIEDMARHMSEQKTLLIVRNPYSRLFSAYIDKFLLPDHWSGAGRHIVKHYRKNSTSVSRLCGHDVTFKEFINYVIHVGETGNGTQWYYDDHWLPISKVCLPCQIPYRYIAKQEGFDSDREFIFQQFGLEKYFNENFSRVASVSRTISQRIEAFWVTALRGGCLTEKEVMRRMWTSFQLQGYLPWNETVQSNLKSSVKPLKMKTFKNIVLNRFRKYENLSLKHQKVEGMTKAYTALSLTQMRKIQSIYDMDFKLFWIRQRT